MDDKLRKLSASLVRHSTVPKDQILDVTELDHRKVRGERSLHSLFACNTDTYICLLDHGYIITSITNASNTFLGVVLDVSCDLSLLFGTASANTDTLGLSCHSKESLANLIFCHDSG
jgi:hypothetical protein